MRSKGIPGAGQHRGFRPIFPSATGGYLEQADGTAWMALFCQNMVEISAELALANPAYVDLTTRFLGTFS